MGVQICLICLVDDVRQFSSIGYERDGSDYLYIIIISFNIQKKNKKIGSFLPFWLKIAP